MPATPIDHLSSETFGHFLLARPEMLARFGVNVIAAMPGTDETLVGTPGIDIFVFRAGGAPGEVDTIEGFEAGKDKIVIQADQVGYIFLDDFLNNDADLVVDYAPGGSIFFEDNFPNLTGDVILA